MASPKENGRVFHSSLLPSKRVRCRDLDPLRFIIKDIKDGKDLNCLEPLDQFQELAHSFRERLLASRVQKGRSPLVTAAQYNRNEVLKHILDTYPVNLEQETSTDIEGGHPVEGATPLWTASTLGFIEIVTELVKRGADIEHTTDSQSSPLRGAAFDGHLNVVQYLVSEGADIDKPNQVGQSPLTIAAAMKKVDTVKFLLEKGASIHHKGHNGDTPLHVAVESGSSDITKLLVEAGAKNLPNDVGYTPAIMACCYGHQSIMEYLHTTFCLGTQELYDCYCLLVAKEVLNSDIVAATKWLSEAVTLRREWPQFSIDLLSYKSDSIYDGIIEPSTREEIRLVMGDNVMSFFLCAVYCERILGAIHPTTPFYIRISGDMALEEGRYDKCMELWLRSLKFDKAARMAYELQIIEDLLFSVRGFCNMIEAGYVPQIHQHFEWGVKEFRLAKESKISEVDVMNCLCRLMALWFLVLDVCSDRVRERERINSAVKQVCSLMAGKNCPVLIACLCDILTPPRANNAVTSVANASLPLHRVLEALMDNGCPVNSEDSMGNFPLHLAVQLKEDSSLECVRTLVEYGAHLDAVNHNNDTALSIALKKKGFVKNNEAIIEFLRTATRHEMSLQCLSAVTLVREGVAYANVLPKFLISFVAKHEADGLIEVIEEEPVNEGSNTENVSISSSDFNDT